MNKILSLFVFLININLSLAQVVDLRSVDEFIKLTTAIKEGKKISKVQWANLENSTAYKKFAERENKFLINTIKTSINIAFGNSTIFQRDSILNISSVELDRDKKLFMKKFILVNYLDINKNYKSIKIFRQNYDFDSLVSKAKQRLSSFLGQALDSTKILKPVYFFFTNADGADFADAIYIDFNLIYKMTEDQRINFLAHEYFHNYRRYFENNDFNYKSDLNFCLDMIQNEGIADQIDKSGGFVDYYSKVIKSPKLATIMMKLYNNAERDLETFQGIILEYSENKISQKETIDQILEVYKFNGHAIGSYISNQIVKAGYRDEMIKTFYDTYEFYNLYNKAAKHDNLFQFNDEFMKYLKHLTRKN